MVDVSAMPDKVRDYVERNVNNVNHLVSANHYEFGKGKKDYLTWSDIWRLVFFDSEIRSFVFAVFRWKYRGNELEEESLDSVSIPMFEFDRLTTRVTEMGLYDIRACIR